MATGVSAPTKGARAAERARGRQPIPDEVIDAARQNFLRFGVNRTTMADIARAVGTPRQTLYEYVSSRDELVDAVLVLRIREIAEALTPSGDEAASFTDAFVETSTAAITAARGDHELMNIVATGPIDRVQDIVTGPHAEVHEIVAHLLEPILDRGQATGQLRADKSRDDIIDWVRIVYLSLISQTSIELEKVSDLVGSFLLPAIMFDKDAARR